MREIKLFRGGKCWVTANSLIGLREDPEASEVD